MRRQHLTQLIGILVVATALIGLPSAALAVITGSAHDFKANSWSSQEPSYSGEICAACHTPHNASTTVADAPLWDHEVSVSTGFQMYTSTTLDATLVTAPGGISLLCLSCHDGTVALDSFGGVTGTTSMATTADAYFSKDLRNDHPISITYNAALNTADDGVNDPTTTLSGLGLNIDDDMLFGGASDLLECASCHDVHNDDATTVSLLRITNEDSALCLTCHNK